MSKAQHFTRIFMGSLLTLSLSCGEIRIGGVPLEELAKGNRNEESTEANSPTPEASQRPKITITAQDIPQVVNQLAGNESKTWVLQSRTEDGEPPEDLCHGDDQLVIFVRKLIEIRVGNAHCRLPDGSLDKDISASWQLTNNRSILIISQEIPPYQVHILELSDNHMLTEFTDLDGTVVQERYAAVITSSETPAEQENLAAASPTPQPGSIRPDVPENPIPVSGGFGTSPVPDIPVFGPGPNEDEEEN